MVNGDFASTMKAIVPDRLRRRWTDARIDAKRFSCSTFMLYLGLEGRFDDMHHHTIFLSGDYLENIREIDAGLAPEEPTIYVQNASVTDPTLAPARPFDALRARARSATSPAASTGTALAPIYRTKVLKRLERLCGHDIEPRIRTERMLTPNDWQAQMAVFRGATFNLAHNLGQMLHLRPRNRFEDLERRLPDRRRHPSRQRPAHDLRERADREQARRRGPRPATRRRRSRTPSLTEAAE